jgi:predicted AAA+ superfamily ATPase
MKNLQDYQLTLLKQVNNKFYRSIYYKIDWDIRMVGLKGPRGVGKTTLMLQHLKYQADKKKNPLYITMDHPQFYNQASLFETAQEYYQFGGRYLFIDEVHKYEHWSRELKVIYDGFPDLKVVFSASSALEIYKGESDLSRRVFTYDFPGMSFREYFKLKHNIVSETIQMSDILRDHQGIATRLGMQFQPLPLFISYLKEGYLPVIKNVNSDLYLQQLIQIINTTVNQDLQFSKKLSTGSINRLKRILGIIAESVPYEPNITSIASKIGIRRELVYNFLTYLEQARLLNNIRKKPGGITTLQKPGKIYLENTNLNYALQANPDIGTIRETFFLNQLRNAGHNVQLPKEKGDFLVDGKFIFEVGGKDKQVSNKNMYIAADNIETGFVNKIPLWLFGFLY